MPQNIYTYTYIYYTYCIIYKNKNEPTIELITLSTIEGKPKKSIMWYIMENTLT
jgi:hypothetical protein